MHLSSVPVALVRLSLRPILNAITMGKTFLDFALVFTQDFIVVGNLSIFTCHVLFRFEVTRGDFDGSVIEFDLEHGCGTF
jgi:hypothetical protein